MAYSYSSLISLDKLFQAWHEFKKGKGHKKDVQIFGRDLEDNIFDLHAKLKSKTYKHDIYSDFYVNDPKRRHIHKSSATDRVLHHLLYKYLYKIFDKKFIYDSYSCRKGKGTHKSVKRLEKLTRIVSVNYTRECWALKCDVKKFFDSVDHQILKTLIAASVKDPDTNLLINKVIDSFRSESTKTKGIPLGNVTSQIFSNIYLNELDQFVKHNLKAKYYIRYADDFIILDANKNNLKKKALLIKKFLENDLRLQLHPKKVFFRELRCGIDFCGYIVLPHHILPRTKTRKRIFKKLNRAKVQDQAIQSYLGYFSHANSFKITENIKNQHFFKLNQ